MAWEQQAKESVADALGPELVVGHEGRANVWISHRNAVVKAAGNHVRLAEVEEQLPWHDLYDSLRDTDETYVDLCPPGVSREQYGGPSTSSDVTDDTDSCDR